MELDGDIHMRRPRRRARAAGTAHATEIWRTCRADAIGVAELRRMRAAVAVAAAAGDARWRRAAAGEASAAIGIALDILHASGAGARLDAAMTAVAVCALEGDAAACLVASHVARRLAHGGREEARVATNWLVRAFEGLRARHAATAPRRGRRRS